VGDCIVTFNGDTGAVRGLKLDEHHGLCFTLDDPVDDFVEAECGIFRRWYPVSTIARRGTT
jgi:hypothetical protein